MEPDTEQEKETHKDIKVVAPSLAYHAPEFESVEVTKVITPVRGGAYLPEYLVMLILLGVILSAVTTLIGVGIHSLVPQSTVTDPYNYSYDPTSMQLSWSLSAVLAATPLFTWLFVRTRKVETAVAAVKQHRWRKAFLGIFLVVQSLVIVSVLANMVYRLIAPLFGDDGSGGMIINYLFTTMTETSNQWWETVVTSLITVVILAYTVYVLSDDYRSGE